MYFNLLAEEEGEEREEEIVPVFKKYLIEDLTINNANEFIKKFEIINWWGLYKTPIEFYVFLLIHPQDKQEILDYLDTEITEGFDYYRELREDFKYNKSIIAYKNEIIDYLNYLIDINDDNDLRVIVDNLKCSEWHTFNLRPHIFDTYDVIISSHFAFDTYDGQFVFVNMDFYLNGNISYNYVSNNFYTLVSEHENDNALGFLPMTNKIIDILKRNSNVSNSYIYKSYGQFHLNLDGYHIIITDINKDHIIRNLKKCYDEFVIFMENVKLYETPLNVEHYSTRIDRSTWCRRTNMDQVENLPMTEISLNDL
jgi:hypothetical protein